MFDMKKMQWGICFFVICVVAFAMGIITGFLRNSIKEQDFEEDIEPHAAKSVIAEEETVTQRVVERICYTVISYGEDIVLLENFSDGSEVTLESTPMNKSVLPKEDIVLLEEGINFENKDEALMMIENFVS